MRFGLVGLVLLSFLCGMLTPSLIEQPQLPRSPLAAERASPQDWVSEESIHIYSDRIIIDVPNAKWAKFADTNSMDPILDEGSNGIQVVPSSPEQLQIGDVVTYDYDGRKIIHRIMEIGVDDKGTYYIVKGDNNAEPDPQKVRFEQIERVLIGVIY